MKRWLTALAALGTTLCTTGVAEAALRFERCGGYGFRCARLAVPLDRSGAVPGQIRLLVKRVRAERRPARGATFALAGGPGQSATDAFNGDALGFISPTFRTRDLIVFDQRGTGRSGVLRCRPLERANILDAGGPAADCAARLGPQRPFYTTPDTVEDMEAIRRELGHDRIAIYGTSYGTKVALAYALKYPAHVERLVLDSVVEAAGPNTLYLDSLEAAPRAIRAVCRTACRRFTRDPIADLEVLVARLATGPLEGSVYGRRGRPRQVRLSSTDVFSILVSGDFDPSMRAAFPGAVTAGVRGDIAPLLRLRRRAVELESGPLQPRSLSAAVYAATTCEETELPWERTAAFEDRRSQAAERTAAVPAEAFRPFDRLTVLDNDILNLCSRWPAAAAAPPFGAGPLPDVPVLLLEGEDDLRTPVESAQRVAAQFPQSRVYVASATGHSALGSDFSGCAERAFERFFLGRRLPRPCRRVRRDVLPKPPPPVALRRVRPARAVSGRTGRVVRAVILTLLDVVEDYSATLLTDFSGSFVTRGGGLRGGSWAVLGDGSYVFKRVRFVPGVRVSGRVRHFLERDQRGRLRVSGEATPGGLLRLRGKRLRGRLGGRRIRTRFPIDVALSQVARASRLPGPAGPLRRRP